MNIKEQRKALVNAAKEKDPALGQTQNFMITLSVLLIIFRAAHIVYEFIIAIQNSDFSSALQNVVITLVFICVLYYILLTGNKALVILPIIGSVWSLVQFISQSFTDIIIIFQEGDLFFMGYIAVFLSSALAQGIVMIIFLASPRCKSYLAVMQDIYNQVYKKNIPSKL